MNGIVTGASRGLGLALTRALAERGWRLVVDARDADALERAVAGLDGVVPIAGDVADPEHRARLVDAAGAPIDLLVNNASTLGPRHRWPLPALGDYGLEALRHVYEVNVVAPLALVQLALPRFGEGARIVNVSSDAAVEAYEGWGGYGSSKAALAHLTAVLGVENPGLRAYAVDPGRHAHADAAGRLSRRGHLRPAVAGGERARLPRADRGRLAERPLPRERARRGRGVTSLAFELPKPARGARAAGGERTEPRRRAPARQRSRHRRRPPQPLRRAAAVPRAPAISSSSTRPPRSPPRCRSHAPMAQCSSFGSRRRRRIAIPSATGSWSSARATTRSAPSRSASGSHSPAAPMPRSSPPIRQRGSGSRGSSSPSGRGVPRRARPADPLPLRAAQLAALRLPERLRDGARERRDGERRPPVHGRARHPARRRRRPRRSASRCTPASPPRRATSGRTPSGTAFRSRPRGS